MAGWFSGRAPEGRLSVGEEQCVVASARAKVKPILLALTPTGLLSWSCSSPGRARQYASNALSRASHFLWSDSVVAQLAVERSLSDVENFRGFPAIAARLS